MADLPSIQAEGLTQPADLTRSAGAGSAATASAFGRLAQTADSVTDMLLVHQHTVDAAQVAKLRSSVDEDIATLHAANLTNPQGFKDAYADYRSKLIAATPSRYVNPVASYADGMGGRTAASVTMASAQQDHKNAIQALTARATSVSTRIGDALGDGRGVGALATDPQLQSDQQEFASTFDSLVKSGAMSREEADLKLHEETTKWKAAAVTGHVLRVYHDAGADAALKELSRVGDDQTLDAPDRLLAFQRARTALNGEMKVDDEQRTRARTLQDQNIQDAERLIGEDAASTRLSGQGTGITEDQVQKLGGMAAVAKWYKEKADALESYRLTGDLSRLSPEEAAQRIAQVAAVHGDKLPDKIANEKEFGSLSDAMALVETHGNSAQISPKGAIGKYQIMPDTAALVLGHPLSAAEKDRLLHDDAFNGQVHREILSKNLSDNRGDPFKAVLAYHSGQANVDKWVREYGDPAQVGYDAWLQKVHDAGNPESAAYPKLVAAAMKNGQAWQAWDSAQRQRQDDPAAAVASDPVVQSATQVWAQRQSQVGPNGSGGEMTGGFTVVQANLDAQKRAGIKPKNMQPLPNAALDDYANQYKAIVAQSQAAKDPGMVLRWRDKVVQQFMDPSRPNSQGYGRRVLQAVFSRAGASDMAADVASNLTTKSAGAAPVSRADASQAANAARVDALHRAATGTQPPPSVSAEAIAELRANRADPVYLNSFRRHFGDPARYLGGN
jgi:hypothetical protein